MRIALIVIAVFLAFCVAITTANHLGYKKGFKDAVEHKGKVYNP